VSSLVQVPAAHRRDAAGSERILCPDPACARPALIEDRWISASSDGPVEMVKTRCEDGCWYTVLATSLRAG